MYTINYVDPKPNESRYRMFGEVKVDMVSLMGLIINSYSFEADEIRAIEKALIDSSEEIYIEK